MKKIFFTLIILSFSHNLFAAGGWYGDKVRAATNNTWVVSVTPPTVYAGDWFEGEIWLWYQNDPGIGAQFKYTTDNWSSVQYDLFSRGEVSGNDARYSNEGSAIGPWIAGTTVKYQIQCWHAWQDPDFLTNEASFIVSPLGDPTLQNASTISNSQINLSWTKWNSKNVMIVRKKSTDAWVEPTQGTSYTVGTIIPNSNCKVVYNSNGTSFPDINLSSSTGYDYKFYSENNSYYSVGVTASAITSTGATDYFKSNTSGDWSSVSSWKSSFDNSYWRDATLAPTSVAGSVSVTHGITVTGAETANNLTIGTSGVLTINPTKSLTVTGTLTNDAGTAGLVVKADASGFGSLIESDGVNATVESYISQNSSSSWHFISSPVSAALADVFEGKYLQKHTESNNSYTDITSLTDPLTVMKGFAVWGNPGFAAYYEGQLNAGNKSIGINRTEAGINSGWNLVGNPYPSVIDWDATSGWTKTNVDNTIYIEKNGGFASYTGKVGIIPGEGTNGGSNLIAPGQGFFVSATSIGAGTLAVNNDVRVHSSIPFLKNTTTVPILRLELSGNTFSDESVVRFVPESTNDFDGEYDAHKLFGDVPGLAQCYTLGSLPLAINSIPEATSIPLGVKANTAGTYTIAATELLEIPVVALEDTKTGTFTDLISGSYTFTLEPGENELRFMLHFGTTSVPENEKSISSIYSYQQTVYVNLADNTQGDIYIYNLAGQLVTAKESASGNVRIGLNSMGVYMVKVVTEKETLTQKVVIR